MIYLSLPIDINCYDNPEELYQGIIAKMPPGSDQKLIYNTIFYYFDKCLQKANADLFIDYYNNLNVPIFGDLSKYYPLQNLQPNGGEKGNGATKRSTLYRESCDRST